VDQIPARGGAALTNAWHRGVPVVLEKRLRGSIGSRRKSRVELTVWHPWWPVALLGARARRGDNDF
jgi:hypothetical protein